MAATVSGLHRVADGVRERLLDYVVWIVRALRRPIAERAAKAVRGDVRAVHALKQVKHRHVREREHACGGGIVRWHTEKLNGTIRERDAMLAPGLHAAC